MIHNSCIYCEQDGGEVYYKDELLRVIISSRKNELDIYRLVWNHHVEETHKLSKKNRDHLFKMLIQVETTVASKYKPDKINIASLGNIVPHLHWHIIPRWSTDPWWPTSIWSPINQVHWFQRSVVNNGGNAVTIGIGNWINLNEQLKPLRKKIFPEERKRESLNSFNQLDLISLHVILKVEELIVATGRIRSNGLMEKIGVHPEFRSLGYGQIVLRTLIEEAVKRDMEYVFINVEQPSKNFFIRQGFTSEKKNQLGENIYILKIK
mgnify:CR=1 FL=1